MPVVTHPASAIERCLALREQGLSTVKIAAQTGIARRTIQDWVSGKLPQRPSRSAGCTICGGDADHRSVNDLPPAYVYLLGLYLGDGCIATQPRTYKLRLSLDASYPAIVGEAWAAIEQVVPKNKVNCVLRPSNDVEVYAHSKSWPCLFPQHGPGKKHLRRIALTEWQWGLVRRQPRLLLRGLIHSDGCRS